MRVLQRNSFLSDDQFLSRNHNLIKNTLVINNTTNFVLALLIKINKCYFYRFFYQIFFYQNEAAFIFCRTSFNFVDGAFSSEIKSTSLDVQSPTSFPPIFPVSVIGIPVKPKVAFTFRICWTDFSASITIGFVMKPCSNLWNSAAIFNPRKKNHQQKKIEKNDKKI